MRLQPVRPGYEAEDRERNRKASESYARLMDGLKRSGDLNMDIKQAADRATGPRFFGRGAQVQGGRYRDGSGRPTMIPQTPEQLRKYNEEAAKYGQAPMDASGHIGTRPGPNTKIADILRDRRWDNGGMHGRGADWHKFRNRDRNIMPHGKRQSGALRWGRPGGTNDFIGREEDLNRKFRDKNELGGLPPGFRPRRRPGWGDDATFTNRPRVGVGWNGGNFAQRHMSPEDVAAENKRNAAEREAVLSKRPGYVPPAPATPGATPPSAPLPAPNFSNMPPQAPLQGGPAQNRFARQGFGRYARWPRRPFRPAVQPQAAPAVAPQPAAPVAPVAPQPVDPNRPV